MDAKQWRMENAKLARAYMAGGETPFSAAQKAHFRSVPDMEAAIAKLEKVENGESSPRPRPAAPVQQEGECRHVITPAAGSATLVPAGEWRSPDFLIKKYVSDGIHPDMVRVFAGGRISFIYFDPKEANQLIRLINEATGVLDKLYAEFEELRSERDEEAKRQLAELQRNEKLSRDLAEAQEQVKQLERKLKDEKSITQVLADVETSEALQKENEDLREALLKERALVAKLKDKIVELVMEV